MPFVRGVVPYAGVATVLYGCFAVLGVAVGYKNATTSPLPVRTVPDGGFEAIQLSAFDLFVHNSIVCLQLIGGVLTIGVATVLILLLNGLALGSVLGEASTVLGPGVTAALIVPHGLFEIPALLLATALGFRWTHVLWKVASGKNRQIPIPRHLLHTVGWMILIGALLAVAAVIEADLTLQIARVVS
ncbi:MULTISPECIES: stage II sporulation protein M [unclassified Halorhabdus]|uniref:stage II sporulation protein M n=1 Tax=unclassified Halorhabdus TaxID=2621901 RepID=UPI0023DC0F80|nr:MULTISPECIES: stage II sporulation protein M [unclassified Halorhabdus]WEL21316.1 Stage II sporulation protein M [Halorhabdus sp. BNX81]